MKPVILEVAVNGLTTPDRNPAVPVSASEVTQDILACLEAGASVVHSHCALRSPDAYAVAEDYAQAYRPVLQAYPDAILYPTINTVFGADVPYSPESKCGHFRLLGQEGLIRMALYDPGAAFIGETGADGLPKQGGVYSNSPDDIRLVSQICADVGLGAAISVFEPGWLHTICASARKGTLPNGSRVNFYFGGKSLLAEKAGADSVGTCFPPPIPEALDLYLAMIEGLDLVWSVGVLGEDILDTPIAGLALERGGNIRVGIEDHMDAKSNLQELERAKQVCARMGRPVATAGQTAEILGLPPPILTTANSVQS